MVECRTCGFTNTDRAQNCAVCNNSLRKSRIDIGNWKLPKLRDDIKLVIWLFTFIPYTFILMYHWDPIERVISFSYLNQFIAPEAICAIWTLYGPVLFVYWMFSPNFNPQHTLNQATQKQKMNAFQKRVENTAKRGKVIRSQEELDAIKSPEKEQKPPGISDRDWHMIQAGKKYDEEQKAKAKAKAKAKVRCKNCGKEARHRCSRCEGAFCYGCASTRLSNWHKRGPICGRCFNIVGVTVDE